MFRPFRVVTLILFTLYLAGCATYGQDVRSGLALAQNGQFEQAASAIEQALDPKGDDRLLYYTELGVVYHLAGDYEKSNRLLASAERIAEDLYTKRIGDMLSVAMSNPRQGVYRAADFERVFINYYKALNYFMMAANGQTRAQKERALEGARVESRRMDMILRSIEHKQGSYQEQADKEKSMFSKLMRIFEMISGEIIDKNKIVYRNDAFGHYLAGVIYEQHREYDDARVAYQKAASLYEGGYQQQYGLDSNMTEQAWFDTIRMMQEAGGWKNEWPSLSRSKLSKSKRAQLRDFKRNGHLLVIEHSGLVPERDEMNLMLHADLNTREVVVSPILTGNQQRQLDQRFWFFALYADKGIKDVLSAAYEERMVPAILQFGLVKREYLGPLWGVADGLGLVNVLKDGMRITVPYYRLSDFTRSGASTLKVNGESQQLILGQSVSNLAIQQQLLSASRDMQEAMARAAFKNLSAAQAASLGGDASAVLGFIGKIAANASSAAETRNWLLLPKQIKITRIALPPGQHAVSLASELSGGQSSLHSTRVDIEAGKMSVWKVRSFAHKRAAPKAEASVQQAGL